MRNVREVLRLRWSLGRSTRETAAAVGVSTGVVGKIAQRATTAGLNWAAVEALDDAALERRLYGAPAPTGVARAEPDPGYIHQELRKPGVTLELLHLEYLTSHPTGLQYTAFCDRYQAWKRRLGLTMRQAHKAGEKMYVDFSGKKPRLVAAARASSSRWSRSSRRWGRRASPLLRQRSARPYRTGSPVTSTR